ncbi:MAG: glycosyltransferase [Acidobacteriota bacterium]
MTTPRVSVVMAVYNGGPHLAATLDSLLAQTFTDFELIAIDDGSTDGTLPILAAYRRRDARIRLLTQTNQGLTHALIRGCAEARAGVIARQDCGDRSHPERLAKQLALLAGDVVLVSSAVRAVTPDGELLFVTRLDGDEARRSLLHDDARHIKSIPHHGSAMFSRHTYVAAGGYREPFRVAQDVDLWVRMASLGRIAVAVEELYEATVHPTAISSVGRKQQIEALRLIVAMRDGGDATALLAAAARLRPMRRSARREAASLYFMARCLRARRSTTAREYLLRAIRRNPLHWRAWASLLTGK